MQPLEHGDPRAIGPHGVLARIGTGGTGVVYFGRTTGGRPVAIKVAHPELAGDPELRERFRREVAAARAVGGAFSPPLIDADPEASPPWLVTEFLPSVSLREVVREFGEACEPDRGRCGPMPPGAVWLLAAGLAEALLSIHRAGIVHRDLQPSNVLLSADGPRVIDFGIACPVDAGPTHPAGTQGYMSPEQVSGAPAGPESDIYSYGATLAYACTGTDPRAGEPPLPDAFPDQSLRALIASCLHHDPSARPSALALTRDLARVAEDSRQSGVHWPPPAVAAAIDQRAREANNPPVAALPVPPAGPGLTRRRALLAAGAVGVLAVAGTGAGALALSRLENRSPPAAAPPPTGAASPTGAPSPETPVPPARELEFYLTGDVPLRSLTYTVNGDSTTLRDVELPWRKVVDVPPLPEQSTYRLRFRYPPGEVRYRVLVDGFQVVTGVSGSAGQPGRYDTDENQV